MRLLRRLGQAPRAGRAIRLVSPDTRQCKPWPPGGLLVGGAVRDLLLGEAPRDYDWLVADPQAAAERCAVEIGGSCFPLDEARGHWRAVAPDPDQAGHDFTAPRHAAAGPKLPSSLLPAAAATLSASLNRGAVPAELDPGAVAADLAGRDLTINAMALSQSGALLDPLQGAADLNARTIRICSRQALAADSIRPLRALRFAAALGFALDGPTRQAVADEALATVRGERAAPAWERVAGELTPMLAGEGAARGMALVAGTAWLGIYLPELEACRAVAQGAYHHLDVLGHSLEALARLTSAFPEADLALRWATLLHDIGKPGAAAVDDFGRAIFHGHAEAGAELARDLLRRLRLPAETVARVASLVRYHMLPLPTDERAARRFVHRRRELLPDLLKLMIADREAARGRLASEAGRRAYRLALGQVLAILDELPKPAPLLSGEQVMTLLSLPPGPRVGEALALLAEAAAVGDVRDEAQAKELLLRFARSQGW